jgi:cytochrome P450
LYPPITFMPRVAAARGHGGWPPSAPGALVMIAPWTLQRHSKWWPDPHAFKPERFLPEQEEALVQGAYIPFGQGPHTCVGAGFAQTESVLILAELVRQLRLVAGAGSNCAARCAHDHAPG